MNCINMITDIECMAEPCTTCLGYQQTQPQEKALHHEIPWEVFGADIL